MKKINTVEQKWIPFEPKWANPEIEFNQSSFRHKCVKGLLNADHVKIENYHKNH